MNTDVYAVLLSLITVGALGLTVEQTELSWTKPVGKRVEINCRVTGLQSNYVHWYQQKDGEGLRRVQYANQGGNNLIQNLDFSVKVNGNNYVLKVNRVQKIHAGVYYCAAWDSSSHSDTNCSHPLQ